MKFHEFSIGSTCPQISPKTSQDIPRPPGARAQLQTREPTITGAELPGFRIQYRRWRLLSTWVSYHSPRMISGEKTIVTSHLRYMWVTKQSDSPVPMWDDPAIGLFATPKSTGWSSFLYWHFWEYRNTPCFDMYIYIYKYTYSTYIYIYNYVCVYIYIY